MNFYKKQLLCVISLLSCITYHSNKGMFPIFKELCKLKEDLFDQGQTKSIELLKTKKALNEFYKEYYEKKNRDYKKNACAIPPEMFFGDRINNPLKPKQ